MWLASFVFLRPVCVQRVSRFISFPAPVRLGKQAAGRQAASGVLLVITGTGRIKLKLAQHPWLQQFFVCPNSCCPYSHQKAFPISLSQRRRPLRVRVQRVPPSGQTPHCFRSGSPRYSGTWVRARRLVSVESGSYAAGPAPVQTVGIIIMAAPAAGQGKSLSLAPRGAGSEPPVLSGLGWGGEGGRDRSCGPVAC